MSGGQAAMALLFAVGLCLLLAGTWLHRRGRAEEADLASLMYTLTHDELTNPLQSALAALVNLERRLAPLDGVNGVNDEDIRSLRGSLSRLIGVTRNLRALVLLELPRSARVRERLNMTALLQSLIVEHGERADEEGVRLACDGGEQAVHVLGQRDELARVFGNVIDNAIKYSRHVPDACVLVGVVTAARRLRVTVTDNGKGMSPERIAGLGQVPQRPSAHSVGTRGAGLGLLLARRILERHGGSLAADSVEGRGTSMTIELPLARGRA